MVRKLKNERQISITQVALRKLTKGRPHYSSLYWSIEGLPPPPEN